MKEQIPFSATSALSRGLGLALLLTCAAAAAQPQTIPIWPGVAPGSEKWTQTEGAIKGSDGDDLGVGRSRGEGHDARRLDGRGTRHVHESDPVGGLVGSTPFVLQQPPYLKPNPSVLIRPAMARTRRTLALDRSRLVSPRFRTG